MALASVQRKLSGHTACRSTGNPDRSFALTRMTEPGIGHSRCDPASECLGYPELGAQPSLIIERYRGEVARPGDSKGWSETCHVPVALVDAGRCLEPPVLAGLAEQGERRIVDLAACLRTSGSAPWRRRADDRPIDGTPAPPLRPHRCRRRRDPDIQSSQAALLHVSGGTDWTRATVLD